MALVFLGVIGLDLGGVALTLLLIPLFGVAGLTFVCLGLGLASLEVGLGTRRARLTFFLFGVTGVRLLSGSELSSMVGMGGAFAFFNRAEFLVGVFLMEAFISRISLFVS